MQTTIPLMFIERAKKYSENPAQYYKNERGNFSAISFKELLRSVQVFASELAKLKIIRGERVALIADNRPEWLVCDLAILGLGACDVPRGLDVTKEELSYILSFSECRIAIVENHRQLEKVLSFRSDCPLLTTLIILDEVTEDEKHICERVNLKVLSFSKIMEQADKIDADSLGSFYEAEAQKGKASDCATIIYTSGTTGEPKGVMLSHRNFLCQLEQIPDILNIKVGQRWLSVLPVWHVFERLMQYVALESACSLAYSKPLASVLLKDFMLIQPEWMASVPRIWEAVMDGVFKTMRKEGGIKNALFLFFVSLAHAHKYAKDRVYGTKVRYNLSFRTLDFIFWILPLLLLDPLYLLGEKLVYGKIKAKLGSNFIAGISGGGALPKNVDAFFSSLGITVLEGYGLTETAPVIAVRKTDKNVSYSVGELIKGTTVKIVNAEGALLSESSATVKEGTKSKEDRKNSVRVKKGFGHQGRILVSGEQVMLGYFKRPDLTAKVMKDGFFDTGDLGMLSMDGCLAIRGRVKDTIVLRGGENVEPAPIEAKLTESIYIAQAMVVGQDEKYLGALIVPDKDNLSSWAKEKGIYTSDWEKLLAHKEIKDLLLEEINKAVSLHSGFKAFERITKFAILPELFVQGKELSHKQELMRHKVVKIYAKEVTSLFLKTA